MAVPPIEYASPPASHADSAVVAHDDAARLLGLAARLHAANGDVGVWLDALSACRDWFECRDGLDVGGQLPAGPHEVTALAERVARCANEGLGGCARAPGNALKRGRCGALAPHVVESAAGLRRALWASDYDSDRACWILARDARVLDANPAARRITAAGDRLRLAQGRLAPAGGLAGARLLRSLASVDAEALFAWPDRTGAETTLRLRPSCDTIVVTLVQEDVDIDALAGRLARLLDLPPRQAKLAAHLANGLGVAAAARAMGISRDTANDHLRGLRRHTGTADRAALVALLRRSLLG